MCVLRLFLSEILAVAHCSLNGCNSSCSLSTSLQIYYVIACLRKASQFTVQKMAAAVETPFTMRIQSTRSTTVTLAANSILNELASRSRTALPTRPNHPAVPCFAIRARQTPRHRDISAR
jgi:hypothetical protein